MTQELDCGWLSGSLWAFSTEVDEAIKSLPAFSRLQLEQKLTARIKLLDKVSGWEWYLCEFDRKSKRARGLVKGYAIESGYVSMAALSERLQSRLMVKYDFKPTFLSKIREELNNQMSTKTSDSDQTRFAFDVFVSYATEDSEFASQIVGGLLGQGIRAWYAPLTLKVGDPLRKSIENGLRDSYAGIVIVSKHYVAKHWTEYEFDTLIRQYIEEGKKVLPIWHGVTRTEVDRFSTGLSGIVALQSSSTVQHIIDNLVYSLSGSAPTRGVVPSWEEPAYRFLNGRAELLTPDEDGLAFTVWEAALHFPEGKYPIWIQGKLISRDEVLYSVAEILAYNPSIIQVTEDERKRLAQLCKSAGHNPENLL